MDWLVWVGVIAAVLGAGLFAFGMRHDPILAAAVPGGMGLVTAVLLYFILSTDSPRPSPIAASESGTASPSLEAPPADPQSHLIDALQPKSGPGNPGQTLDVLSRIHPVRNQLLGQWTMEDGALISSMGQPVKIVAPVRLPRKYRLTAEVQRLQGTDAISFGLTIGGRDVTACFDGYNRGISGLNLIDRSTADRNESLRRGPFIRGMEPTTIVCMVEENSIHATCNGRVAIDWRGDVNRLSEDSRWPNGLPGLLEISTWNTRFRITKLELTILP